MMEIKFDRIAGKAELEQRKRQSIAELLHEEHAHHEPMQQKTRTKNLDPKLIAYLKLIKENPGIPATERDKKFGVLPKYGTTYRKQLLEAGLIEEVRVVSSNGKYFKDVRLTPAGQDLL